MIELKQISRHFFKDQRKIEVLNDFNLSIENGECVAITGPNGIGKSTLFRILSTLIIPNTGMYYIDGVDAIKNPKLVRNKLAWSSGSDGGFFQKFTGKENLLFFASLEGITQKEAILRMDKFIHHHLIQEILETQYYLCSAGMKQILNVLRALIYQREILLLDEPTRSLDVASTEFIMKLLQEYKGQKTILYTTHRTNELGLADHVVELKSKGATLVAAS